MSTKSLILSVLTVILSLLLMGSAAWAGEPIDRISSASPDGTVEISNLAGTVTIIGWDRSEIQVTGTLGEGSERLDFEVDGDETEIEVVLPKRSSGVEGTDLEIHLPRASQIEVETVSAPISISKVTGSVEAASVSGSIELECESEEVEVATVSGSLTIRGSIGELEAATVSGRIKIQGGTIEDLEAESVSGSIELSGNLSKGGSYSLESFSGSVVLSIPEDVDASFEVETFSGSVKNHLSDSKAAGSLGKRLEFTIGSGSARVTVETFSGKVEIRSQ